MTNIKDAFSEILYRSRINSSLLFEVQVEGKTHFVPIEGITACVMNLNKSNQQKLLNRCQRLQNNPEELLDFFRKLASSVAKRKL